MMGVEHWSREPATTTTPPLLPVIFISPVVFLDWKDNGIIPIFMHLNLDFLFLCVLFFGGFMHQDWLCLGRVICIIEF